MLQKVERLFTREQARVDIGSQVLLNNTADQRAESNFHFIMTNIRAQNIDKLFRKAMREQRDKEQKTQGREVPIREIKQILSTKAVPIDPKEVDISSDNLVTCKEFMSSLKNKKFIKPIKQQGKDGKQTNKAAEIKKKEAQEPIQELYNKILPRTLSF